MLTPLKGIGIVVLKSLANKDGDKLLTLQSLGAAVSGLV